MTSSILYGYQTIDQMPNHQQKSEDVKTKSKDKIASAENWWLAIIVCFIVAVIIGVLLFIPPLP